MVEVKDGKKILTTPISAEDLKDIKIGDIIYLNGSMTTCRDVAHRRLVEEGRELPVDVRNNAIFHAGPIIRPLENDKFEMVSVRAAYQKYFFRPSPAPEGSAVMVMVKLMFSRSPNAESVSRNFSSASLERSSRILLRSSMKKWVMS